MGHRPHRLRRAPCGQSERAEGGTSETLAAEIPGVPQTRNGIKRTPDSRRYSAAGISIHVHAASRTVGRRLKEANAVSPQAETELSRLCNDDGAWIRPAIIMTDPTAQTDGLYSSPSVDASSSSCSVRAMEIT